jgi:SAM-dependent methyltransferase
MTPTEWTIPGLLQLSGGYWSTCALHVGVKQDIFTVVADTARTSAEVALLTGTDVRATGMLLESLAALGLLEKNGDTYKATPFSVTCLSQKSPEYLGHIIMHHHYLMTAWSRLDESIATGAPIRESVSHNDNESVRESFLMGMFNLANLIAPRIAKSLNLAGCRRLLDLGGGPGTYAIHFCHANPDLSAVVYDLPTTRIFAERIIAHYDLSDRISFAPGNYHTDPVPSGFDAAWLSHVLHSEGPEECVALLNKTAEALSPGGILMVQEFIVDEGPGSSEFPALFSLNMLLGTEAGQSYTERELVHMMAAVGFTDVERVDLGLPNGAGIIRGRKG